MHLHDVGALSVASNVATLLMQPIVDGVVAASVRRKESCTAVHVDPLLLGYLRHVFDVLRIAWWLHWPRVESEDGVCFLGAAN